MMMKKPFLSEYLLGGRKVIFSGFRSLCFFSFWEEGVATVFLSLYANEANETARFIYIYIYATGMGLWIRYTVSLSSTKNLMTPLLNGPDQSDEFSLTKSVSRAVKLRQE